MLLASRPADDAECRSRPCGPPQQRRASAGYASGCRSWPTAYRRKPRWTTTTRWPWPPTTPSWAASSSGSSPTRTAATRHPARSRSTPRPPGTGPGFPQGVDRGIEPAVTPRICRKHNWIVVEYDPKPPVGVGLGIDADGRAMLAGHQQQPEPPHPRPPRPPRSSRSTTTSRLCISTSATWARCRRWSGAGSRSTRGPGTPRIVDKHGIVELHVDYLRLQDKHAGPRPPANSTRPSMASPRAPHDFRTGYAASPVPSPSIQDLDDAQQKRSPPSSSPTTTSAGSSTLAPTARSPGRTRSRPPTAPRWTASATPDRLRPADHRRRKLPPQPDPDKPSEPGGQVATRPSSGSRSRVLSRRISGSLEVSFEYRSANPNAGRTLNPTTQSAGGRRPSRWRASWRSSPSTAGARPGTTRSGSPSSPPARPDRPASRSRSCPSTAGPS